MYIKLHLRGDVEKYLEAKERREILLQYGSVINNIIMQTVRALNEVIMLGRH